jgi:hypothetical protein
MWHCTASQRASTASRMNFSARTAVTHAGLCVPGIFSGLARGAVASCLISAGVLDTLHNPYSDTERCHTYWFHCGDIGTSANAALERDYDVDHAADYHSPLTTCPLPAHNRLPRHPVDTAQPVQTCPLLVTNGASSKIQP